MDFKLLTPDGQVYSGEAELVGGRTEKGSFSMLPRHIPAVMELEPATLKIEDPGGIRRFVVHGGYLFKERDETIRVLTREAEIFEELEPAELEKEIKDLEKQLEEMENEEGIAAYEKKQAELDRAKLNLRLISNE